MNKLQNAGAVFGLSIAVGGGVYAVNELSTVYSDSYNRATADCADNLTEVQIVTSNIPESCQVFRPDFRYQNVSLAAMQSSKRPDFVLPSSTDFLRSHHKTKANDVEAHALNKQNAIFWSVLTLVMSGVGVICTKLEDQKDFEAEFIALVESYPFTSD